MPDGQNRARKASGKRIRRIVGRQAAKVMTDCDDLLLHSTDLLADLSRLGFSTFLRSMTEDMLQLAIQPDPQGDRLRARLMCDLAPALQCDASKKHAVSIDDIVYCSNIVMPCLLLELGRRKGHIEIEFPGDPTDSSACFKLRTGPRCHLHSFHNHQLLQLASNIGEELVGLCYFGDPRSRERIEAELRTQHAA
jgi:hypothetical protein